MPKQKEYSDDIKSAVIAALKNGKSQAQVARDFNLSRQIISVWNRKEQSTGSVSNKQRSGRPPKLTDHVSRIIRRMSIANPRLTAADIKRDLNENHSFDISLTTVKQCLRNANLFGRRPSKKPFIFARNRKARLEFAQKYKNWTSQEWARVLWSDESKFNMFSSDGIRYIRRPPNKRDDPKYQVPTVKHGGGHVMVWGCFSRSEVGPLVEVKDIMDRFRYCEILQNHMLPYAKRNLARNWIFQQDNDPKHTSAHVKEFFTSKKIKVLEWPSQSPDLNPIEHLWEELDRRIRKRKFSRKQDLMACLAEEWKEIPLTVITKLIDSMPARCAAVIKSKGFATKY